MKKFTTTVLALIMVMSSALCLTSCGKAAKTPAPNDVTAAVMKEIEIPSFTEKTIDSIADYYDITVADIEAMSVYICGSGAYPDEIAVFKMKDKDKASTAKAAVEKRLEMQKKDFESYTPKEMYKLNDALVLVKDSYCIYVACADNEKASKIINEQF